MRSLWVVLAGLGVMSVAWAGDPPVASQDPIQKVTTELEEMRKRMSALEAELAQLKKDREEKDAKAKADLASLNRNQWRTFIQVQYRDSNQRGSDPDAFQVRRARFGIRQTINPETSFTLSFDAATGTTQNQAQMRDVFATYQPLEGGKPGPTEIRMGQFSMPLGYEIERGDIERETPERSSYNSIMFGGERNRGVQIRHQVDPNWSVSIGGFNAMTQGDPEQRNLAPAPASRHGFSAGVRYRKPGYEIGVSGFLAERPEVTTTRIVANNTVTTVSPAVDREFVYADALITRLGAPKLSLRAEWMKGKDRVPIAPGANSSVTSPRGRTNMTGGHLMLRYDLDPQNVFALKAEQFDPDVDSGINLQQAFGITWMRFLNPSARIALSYEQVEDDARPNGQKRYHITTLRWTYRF